MITVDCGVGGEAVIHLKPGYTFGKSDYAAIAHRVHGVVQFEHLTNPIRTAVSTDDMIRFLHHYRNHYLVGVPNQKRLLAAFDKRVFGPFR